MRVDTYDVEKMKRIIRQATIQLMDYSGTNPEATREVVAEDHPELYTALGAERVLALCWEIHDSNDPLESAWLQELFATFNVKYFGGRLDGFTVLAVYNAGGASNQVPSGWVDFINREINLALTEYRDAMPSILLHHMAHASTVTLDDTEEAWTSEMQRLGEAGAPVEIEGSTSA
jgi:hypothetical protein